MTKRGKLGQLVVDSSLDRRLFRDLRRVRGGKSKNKEDILRGIKNGRIDGPEDSPKGQKSILESQIGGVTSSYLRFLV